MSRADVTLPMTHAHTVPDHVRLSLVEEFMPTYDVSDTVARVVQADRHTTWETLMDVDVIEVGRRRPLVGALGAVRALPELIAHLLQFQALPAAPTRLSLRDLATLPSEQGRWALLGERPDDEIALGLVGRFWRPVIDFATVTRDAFRDFNAPNYAKTIYSLSVRSIDATHTLLSGTMRTATTDDHARAWFRRYWTLGVGSGAHVLVQGVIDSAAAAAEERKAQDQMSEDA